ncbi:MAG: DUF1573 domain-containing protein [Bacteroidales bacterium]
MKQFIALLIAVSTIIIGGFTYAQQGVQPKETQTNQVQSAQPVNPTHLKFESYTRDFGNIPQGIPATTAFTFTNTTDLPIAITNVQKSCGCTAPVYSKEPVLPGKSSTISVTFNAAAPNNFTKSLIITTSENETYTLIIKGNVVPKK